MLDDSRPYFVDFLRAKVTDQLTFGFPDTVSGDPRDWRRLLSRLGQHGRRRGISIRNMEPAKKTPSRVFSSATGDFCQTVRPCGARPSVHDACRNGEGTSSGGPSLPPNCLTYDALVLAYPGYACCTF